MFIILHAAEPTSMTEAEKLQRQQQNKILRNTYIKGASINFASINTTSQQWANLEKAVAENAKALTDPTKDEYEPCDYQTFKKELDIHVGKIKHYNSLTQWLWRTVRCSKEKCPTDLILPIRLAKLCWTCIQKHGVTTTMGAPINSFPLIDRLKYFEQKVRTDYFPQIKIKYNGLSGNKVSYSLDETLKIQLPTTYCN